MDGGTGGVVTLLRTQLWGWVAIGGMRSCEKSCFVGREVSSELSGWNAGIAFV